MDQQHQVDPSSTRLIVLRGNSGSGKSAAAQRIRERYGRGIAIVGQDNLRRVILRELDQPGASNIGLINLTARYALAQGYHVIVEGILASDHYGEMLRRLDADHPGRAHFFYFNVSFAETLRRHATKPQANEFGAAEMRTWYRPCDLLRGVDERIIPETASLDEAVDRIMGVAGLCPPANRAP